MDSGDLGGVGEAEFWRAEAKPSAVENVVLQSPDTGPDIDTEADPRAGLAPDSPADRDGGLDHERHLQPA